MSDSIKGVPVYEVDPGSVRRWCGWRGERRDGRLVAGVWCDSLARGKYVVVWTLVRFGESPKVCAMFSGCRRDCAGFIADLCGGDFFVNTTNSWCGEVEVWHLVPAKACAVCGRECHEGKFVPVSCRDNAQGVVCLDCSVEVGPNPALSDVAVRCPLGGSCLLPYRCKAKLKDGCPRYRVYGERCGTHDRKRYRIRCNVCGEPIDTCEYAYDDKSGEYTCLPCYSAGRYYETCEECGCLPVSPRKDRYGLTHYYCDIHMPLSPVHDQDASVSDKPKPGHSVLVI